MVKFIYGAHHLVKLCNLEKNLEMNSFQVVFVGISQGDPVGPLGFAHS